MSYKCPSSMVIGLTVFTVVSIITLSLFAGLKARNKSEKS